MSAPLLSELREPPVVGRFYMVPTVRYRLRGSMFAWPVLGPRHDDAVELNFPHLHYHFDYRFMSDPMVAALSSGVYDMETVISGTVLVEPTDVDDPHMTAIYGRLPVRPTLRRRKCRRPAWAYSDEARAKISLRNGGDKIGDRYGSPAEPRRHRDGRLLCPHRKVDLSSFPPDADGVVVCPLHGLRVRCGTAQGMSPGTAETPQEVPGEAGQPGPPTADAPESSPDA